MAEMLLRRASDLPRKSPAKATLRGEGARNFLAEVSSGAIIAVLLHDLRLTADQFARELGYSSAASISRWIANEEPLNFTRIWAVERFRVPFLAAQAEVAGMPVERTIRIRRAS
jgi:hypothetical protein